MNNWFNLQKLNCLLSLVVSIGICGNSSALAMISEYETKHVPVERLVRNLTAQEASHSDLEAETEFRIARLYSIAYAQNDMNVPIKQYHKYEPMTDDLDLPDSVRQHWPRYRQFKSESKEKNEDARLALAQSIEHYQKALALMERQETSKSDDISRPDDRRNQLSMQIRKSLGMVLTADDIKLGLGWCLEQDGQIEDAKRLYRAVITSSRTTFRSRNTEFGRLEPDFARSGAKEQTSEARRGYESALYLMPLLDPVQDKAELSELANLPAPDYTVHLKSPIVIPLAKNLSVKDMMKEANVAFDLGDGVRHYTSWPSSKAGWLVYDKDGAGAIRSGSQLFGNYTFSLSWQNGYDALKSLDDNNDGVISGNELKCLAIWQDSNFDGKSSKAEVHPLSDLGVKALSCSFREGSAHMLYGVPYITKPILCSIKGITFTKNDSRATYDIFLQERPLLDETKHDLSPATINDPRAKF